MAERFLLKNIFNEVMVSFIAKNIKAVYPLFRCEAFIDEVMSSLEALSFS